MPAACARLICLAAASLCVTGCAPLLGVVGVSQSVLQIAVVLDRAKLIVDGVSFLESGKTVSDHLLSFAAASDCRTLNLVTEAPICVPVFVATELSPADMVLGAASDDVLRVTESLRADGESDSPVADGTLPDTIAAAFPRDVVEPDAR